MLDAPRDLLLLCLEPFGGEELVGFGIALGAQCVEKAQELRIARAARRAVGQMFGRTRINGLTGSLGVVTVVQPLLLQVARPTDHGFPPSRPRSLRAARNRCTRTVDSFNPVIALTSRGVQSP